MEHVVVIDHGPTKVRVGGRRGRAQDGGRGGADVAALQERDGGAPAGDHTQACTVSRNRTEINFTNCVSVMFWGILTHSYMLKEVLIYSEFCV